MENELEGQLGYKGERGYSAYELAVQHGYQGTEEQWCEDFTNAENFYDKTEMDSILSDYVPKSDIVDNVTSTATNKPLSANQGKVLKDAIDKNFNDTNGVLLWENPYRDNRNFEPQSIEIDLSDYDCIEIVSDFSSSVRMFKYVDTTSSHKIWWTRGSFVFYELSESQIYGRNVYYNIVNNSLVFSECRGYTFNSSSYVTDNGKFAPYYIIGYKKNIFDLDEFNS